MEKEERELLAKLAAKLVKIMEAAERIPKNGWNEYDKYNYVTEADVSEHIRKLLVKHKIILKLTWLERGHVQDWTANQRLVIVKGEASFIDAETGYSIISSIYGDGADKGDKGLYKAYTGAVKFFLVKTFLLATGDDVEAGQKEKNKPADIPRRRGAVMPYPDDNLPLAAQQPAVEAAKKFAAGKKGYWGNLKLATKPKIAQVLQLVEKAEVPLDDFVETAQRAWMQLAKEPEDKPPANMNLEELPNEVVEYLIGRLSKKIADAILADKEEK